jgi:hypothetical protein
MTTGVIPLLMLGSVDLRVLVSQWPLPWLVPSPFLLGDPNAPLLVAQLNIGALEVTERLEFAQQFFSKMYSSQHPESTLLPSHFGRICLPRFSISIEHGPIRALLCADLPQSDEVAMELRTDGGILYCESHFLPGPIADITATELLPLLMRLTGSAILKPTFIRVGCRSQRLAQSNEPPTDALCDPMLTFETIEMALVGTLLGDIKDDTDNTASIALPSTFLDVRLSTDAFCLELWQPDVLFALIKLQSILPKLTKTHEMDSLKTLYFNRLPFGLSVAVSFSRCVVFIAGRDLNPNENLEVSRGIAFRSGLSFQCDAVRIHHAYRFRDLPLHWQRRHKLYLPEDQIIKAISSAKASEVTRDTSTFLRILVWELALRNSTANEYVTDDPYISERDDPALAAQEFFRIRNLKTDVVLSSKVIGMSSDAEVNDDCQVTVDIPYIWCMFQLDHVYCLLLASHTLLPLARPTRSAPRGLPNTLFYRFQVTIKTVQVFWKLPKQSIVTRMNFATIYLLQDSSTGLRWSSLYVWVPVPTHITEWQQNTGERWQELLRLDGWHIALPRSLDDLPVKFIMDGDSARFRIPFGFVFADMIQSLGITIKAVRHLKRIVSAGRYMAMTTPEAESPKLLPNLTVRLRFLSAEAADDPFECQMAIIWRAGPEAAKQRIDLEEAFRVKAATILAANSPDASSPIDLDCRYQFDSRHSVSVEEARQRLYQVHYTDWNLRHTGLKKKRSIAERATIQKLHGAGLLKPAKDVVNLVEVAPIDAIPPLFRLTIHDLFLRATLPSFPVQSLPDFMYDLGDGLPRDTSFSLLLPMHLHFTLGSLRACLRDYPIPLLDIPPSANDKGIGFHFDSDLVIGEEMGTEKSIDWIDCAIAGSLSITVPKTIMPVKTYANPNIRVTTTGVTSFAWAVSVSPAMQDLMRVIETLSSSTHDPSPVLGFWDKACKVNMCMANNELICFDVRSG